MMDKAFVKERIKFVFLIRGQGDVRWVYIFKKNKILNILDKYGKLDLRTITRIRRSPRYCYCITWFRDYKGVLLDAYKDIKEDRMMDKVNSFVEKYKTKEVVEQSLSLGEFAEKVFLNKGTVAAYIPLLEEGKDYFLHPGTGFRRFYPSAVDRFLEMRQEARDKRKNNDVE
jgi:hypothetical protein